MSSAHQNLSTYDPSEVPSAAGLRFGIIVADWNKEITTPLYKGAYDTLINQQAETSDIITSNVPGTYELPLAAQFLAEYEKPDAIICLGCVIQGETRHFDFICQAASDGIMRVSLDYNIPVIFGVLTTNTLEQAKDRAGGSYGNKGIEAAITAIKMAHLQNSLIK